MTAESPAAATDPTRFGWGFAPEAWWFVDLSRAVRPGTQARRTILGEPVLIGRTRAGLAFAMRDVCPHRAAPLSAGRIVDHPGEGETVECPYHGWRFSPDGVCAAIPSLVESDATDPSRIRVRTHPIAESQGLIFVWMSSDPRGGGGPDPAPPEFPGADGRARRVRTTTVEAPLDLALARMSERPPAPPEGGAEVVRAPGWLWTPRQAKANDGPTLTCLTPLDAMRTRIDTIRWTNARGGAGAGLFVRRR